MSDKKTTSSATNRLVELLRSQQVGSPDDTTASTERIVSPPKKLVDEVAQESPESVDEVEKEKTRDATKVLLDVLEKNRSDAKSSPSQKNKADESDENLDPVPDLKSVKKQETSEAKVEKEDSPEPEIPYETPLLIPDPRLMKKTEDEEEDEEEEERPPKRQQASLGENADGLATLLNANSDDSTKNKNSNADSSVITENGSETSPSIDNKNKSAEDISDNKEKLQKSSPSEVPSLLTQIQNPIDEEEKEDLVIKQRGFNVNLLSPIKKQVEVSPLLKIGECQNNWV